jgi:adenine-specific DNA-methyltransferase
MICSEQTMNNSEDYEAKYALSVSLTHRQKYGQFFTPEPVAKFMVKWVLDNKNCQNILDPAFGLGIFARNILEQSDIKVFGFEIDNIIYNQAINLFKNHSVVIKNQDYINNDWDSQYDGIICNPPYFKFHDYDNKEKLQQIRAKLNINLNSCSNLYTLFLLKSIHQLKNGGKAAFLIPSEFMNADYGNFIKDFLIQNNLLEYIIIIDANTNLFNDALTTSCILLLSKNTHNKYVKFLTINNIQELDDISLQINQKSWKLSEVKNYRFSEINPSVKWRIYYQCQNSLKYQNLVPFSTYATIVRGIATGDNDYFTFSQAKKLEYQIKSQYLLPCITKANYANLPFFDEVILEKLINENKKIFLLNANQFNRENDEYIKQYLLRGERQGVNKKYLTSHRNPWYKIEDRLPAPIWVNVFNRKGLRFVRNEANIYNLTTFHCVYPNLLAIHKLELLFAYLITPVAGEIFNDNRREYAQGLQKFEPNDLNNSLIVNLDIIDNNEEQIIIDILKRYRRAILNHDNVGSSKYLTWLNEYFINVLKR